MITLTRTLGWLSLLLALAPMHSSLAGEAYGMDLDFEAEAGRLSGTLFLPDRPGPHPAVIFLAGSGDESYRAAWEGEPRAWFWRELQQWFEGRGWAVYIFDKPGVGRSEGDWRQEDFHARKRNALAAVDALARRVDIDPGRIGLLGHSQGGWIAVMAAAASPETVGFLVSLAGPAIGVRQQIIEDTANRWECDQRRLIGLRRAGLGMMLSSVGGIGRLLPVGYLSGIVRYDPAEDLDRLEQPMLALFAGNDIMVMPETNRPVLEAHFGQASGNRRLTIEVIEGLDHFFRHGEFCLSGGRPQQFAPAFWTAFESEAFWRSLQGP